MASIKAAVTSLLQRDVAWNAEATTQFLATIDEEADRLNRLVGNLLDRGRQGSGHNGVATPWHAHITPTPNLEVRLDEFTTATTPTTSWAIRSAKRQWRNPPSRAAAVDVTRGVRIPARHVPLARLGASQHPTCPRVGSCRPSPVAAETEAAVSPLEAIERHRRRSVTAAAVTQRCSGPPMRGVSRVRAEWAAVSDCSTRQRTPAQSSCQRVMRTVLAKGLAKVPLKVIWGLPPISVSEAATAELAESHESLTTMAP
jgi:hypothetical protein